METHRGRLLRARARGDGAAHQRQNGGEEGEVAARRARRVRDQHDVHVDDERSRRPGCVQLEGEVEERPATPARSRRVGEDAGLEPHERCHTQESDVRERTAGEARPTREVSATALLGIGPCVPGLRRALTVERGPEREHQPKA